MNKSTHFSGTPIIKQILQFILPTDISRTAEKYNSDRYYKKFKTYDHLVTMIYATLSGVSSLRELSTVMLACEGRISHLNLKHFPKRSTLSDANKKRTSEVFGAIYAKLYKRYASFLSVLTWLSFICIKRLITNGFITVTRMSLPKRNIANC